MAKPRPIPLHTWQLHEFTLTPTACRLQAFENRRRPQPDPIVTLRFSQPGEDPQPARELHVPASALKCSSPPFQALVTAGFLESTTLVVHLEPDAYSAFKIIVPFLKCEDIDMRAMPESLPMYADRWGLDDLFDACFALTEIKRWGTCDQFMLFALPLLRYLKVPQTFKHIFAVRLGYGLNEVIDWITGEEDYRIQRLRSIPAGRADSESSDYSPVPNCSILVDGEPCSRPPRKELSDRYFCDEHYQSEYLNGSPRYGARVANFNPPEPPACSPTRKKKRVYYSTADAHLQSSCSEKGSKLPAAIAPSTGVSASGKNTEQNCQLQVNSVSNEGKKPEASIDIFPDSHASSSPLPKANSPVAATCELSPKGAPSIHPSDKRAEDAVSFSPVSSVDEKGASSKPTGSTSPVSPAKKYLKEKRKGRKRNEEYETEDREYALWDAIRMQNMLPQALKELIWHSADGYAGFVLKGILRVLDEELTEDEKIKLLKVLPWERKDFSSTLGSNSDFTWRMSDWRIVAKAQALAAQTHAGGGEEYSKIMHWPFFVENVCDESGVYPAKCEQYGFIDYRDDSSIYVSWRTRKKYDGEYSPLLLNMSNCLSDDLDEDFLERPLDVSVSVRELDCGCEAGSESKKPIIPRMFYGLLREDLKVRTLHTGPGVTFTIMDDFEMSRWMCRHQPTCGLVLGLRIRICDKVQTNADKQSEECSEERLGRGKCPCGSCLEDDMSSGDEIYAAQVDSDTSQDEDIESDEYGDDDDDIDDEDDDNGVNIEEDVVYIHPGMDL